MARPARYDRGTVHPQAARRSVRLRCKLRRGLRGTCLRLLHSFTHRAMLLYDDISPYRMNVLLKPVKVVADSAKRCVHFQAEDEYTEKRVISLRDLSFCIGHSR